VTASRSPAWGREDDATAAVDRLLDVAGTLFADRGVLAVTMRDVATAAGCSRGTVHRYFADRDSLRRAFVDREAARVGAAVLTAIGHVDDPAERLVAAILAALGAVRSDPVLEAWFTPASSATAGHLALGGGTIATLLAAVLDGVFADAAATGRLRPGIDRELAADWVVRVVVSFLTEPAAPPPTRTERRQLESFLVPALFLSPTRSA
jgi:AcrR family transcriptional regulator